MRNAIIAAALMMVCAITTVAVAEYPPTPWLSPAERIVFLSMANAAGYLSENNPTSCGALHDSWDGYKTDHRPEGGVDYISYIAGWVDSDSVINFPTRTYGEHASVVGKWLDRYTGKRNEHRSDCVYWAFKEAYGTK